MANMFLRLAAAVALLLPAAAQAHEGASLPYGSFLAGLTHPVLGLDHLLAMVSVGVISAQIGGRAIWTVPATFVLVMGLGGLLGLGLPGFGLVEFGIAFSVLALGAVIAVDRTLPVSVALVAVAVFATFHGYAHGEEMPELAAPLRYATGFMLGTAVLHLLGVLLGDISRHYQRGKTVLRVAGGAIAATGLGFLVLA